VQSNMWMVYAAVTGTHIGTEGMSLVPLSKPTCIKQRAGYALNVLILCYYMQERV